MKYRIALIVFLSFFLGLQLQAQDTSNLKNSIGIVSNINSDKIFITPIDFYRREPRFLLYYSREIKQLFSLGMSIGYTGKVLQGTSRVTLSENQHHINVELFSRIRLFEEGDFQIYGRPVVGYNLLEVDEEAFIKALDVSADIGLRYTLFSRINIMLEKELVYFNTINSAFGLNSVLKDFRAGLSIDF